MTDPKTLVSYRIPPDLVNRMRCLPEVNWSEVVRMALEKATATAEAGAAFLLPQQHRKEHDDDGKRTEKTEPAQSAASGATSSDSSP